LAKAVNKKLLRVGLPRFELGSTAPQAVRMHRPKTFRKTRKPSPGYPTAPRVVITKNKNFKTVKKKKTGKEKKSF